MSSIELTQGALTREAVDAAFYRASYGEDPEALADPARDYRERGRGLGRKPNPSYDPLVEKWYRFRQLAGDCNVPADDYSARAASPAVARPLPPAAPADVAESLLRRDIVSDRILGRGFGAEEAIAFEIDGRDYSIVTPSAAAIFGRLESDRPFALPRLPHGFWDGLLMLSAVRADIAVRTKGMPFSAAEIDLLAIRLCDELMPDMGIYRENFLAELRDGVAVAADNENLLRSISFKGKPTSDGRVFGRVEAFGEDEMAQLRMFAEFFPPGVPLYESMVWKRFAYSGDLARLPAEAVAHPVVLVGAEHVASLGERWRLEHFLRVPIPLNSYDQRQEILDRCKAGVDWARVAAARHGLKRPIVLLQGGSFAYWLIDRLFAWDSANFYIDLGQALNIWFLDNRRLHKKWITFHARLVMENCGLDEFYASLGVTLTAPFTNQAN